MSRDFPRINSVNKVFEKLHKEMNPSKPICDVGKRILEKKKPDRNGKIVESIHPWKFRESNNVQKMKKLAWGQDGFHVDDNFKTPYVRYIRRYLEHNFREF